jgi:hypothetical protein
MNLALRSALAEWSFLVSAFEVGLATTRWIEPGNARD